MTTAAGSSNPIIDRAIRAARLDETAYEEVARDSEATTQALLVVVAAGILGGIGGLRGGAGPLVAGIIFAPAAWALGSALAYFVGSRVFSVKGVTWIEVARALGFAQAPGVFNVLGIIPILGGLVGLAVGIWTLITGVIALRTALRITTSQAIITAVLSWVVAAVVIGVVLGTIFGAALGVAALAS
jgi:hypothetical protein